MLRLLTFGGLAVAVGSDGVPPRIGSRRLALLAAVAAAGEVGLTRERMVGLFWPEVDEERGRHSLRQALHALREEAGPALLLQRGSALRLDPRYITSDIAEFRAALAAGDLVGAIHVYRGPFLEGFYLAGAGEFERWVERERASLVEAASVALRTLAGQASASHQHEAAMAWWHRLVILEPLSGRTATGYARALMTCGERAQALAALRAHERLVRRELETDAGPEVLALMEELQRAANLAIPPELPPRFEAATAPAAALPPPAPAAAPRSRRRGWVVAALLLCILGLGAAIRWSPWGRPDPGRQSGTVSPVARRLYEEGLASFQVNRAEVARPLMEAALREDSLFAMAAYYLALMGEGHAWELRQRALRLASGAPIRDRMQIRADLLQRDHDPAALVAAREWTERFPADGEAFMVLGSALLMSGDWVGSAAALERALLLFAAESADPGSCRSCEAFDRLTELYFWWDSLAAVERTARRSLARHPNRAGPARDLALAAARAGDSLRALQYLHRMAESTESAESDYYDLRIRLTLEQYNEVSQVARRLLGSPRPSDAALGRWTLAISLRNQGRLEDARALVRTGRIDGGPPPSAPRDPDYLLEAVLALEGGDPGRAATQFEINRRLGIPKAAGTQARWLAWHSTLTATALAAAGDTATVRQLVDTVAYWGERSLYGRDRKVHHFLRGLLLAAEGRDTEAVEAFQRAIYSPTLGYTRINLELARALLRLRRPAEAVPVLQAALRGEVDASNLYVTRTELHEVLAEAFEGAGQPDSARRHLEAVTRALGRADQPFAARREAAREGIRRLARHPGTPRDSIGLHRPGG